MIDLETKKLKLLKQLDCLQQKLEDIQKQIDAQSKIEPVFHDDHGIYAHNDEVEDNFSLWQRARVRIIEKINIANKGDNGFNAGKDNYYICLAHEYGNARSELCIYDIGRAQSIEPMLYTRTYKAAQELLKDPEFCEDMKTYFKGWL